MTIFGGLFGHDKKSARATGAYVDPAPQLPGAPPFLGGMPVGGQGFGLDAPGVLPQNSFTPASALPPAPPVPQRAGAFDRDHRSQTLLAMASGFFGGNGLGDGLSNAARIIAAQNGAATAHNKPVIGGPDNAFEVYTDPKTGEHTYKPIAAAQDYLTNKREKPKDVADLNGRVMFAISQLDPKERAAAFAEVKANPDVYGVRAEALPAAWDDTYGSIAGTSGMTVAQAQARRLAETREAHSEVHKGLQDADRTTRTGITASRAAAATSQGAQRIGLAAKALNLRGGHKAGATDSSTKSEAELLAIALGK